MSMKANISNRKIVKNEGEKPKFIFDIIEDDPKWISLLMEGKTFHGLFELTDTEKKYYELVTLECPYTDIRLNIEDLNKILSPCLQEPIFEDGPLKDYTENLYKDIRGYNNDLSCNDFKVNPFDIYLSAYHNTPYDSSTWFGINEGYVPRLHRAWRYISDVKQRLQAIRYKYRKGKLSDDLHDSEERLRQKAEDIRAEYNNYFIEYGKKLKSYFDEWDKYRDAKKEANNMWTAFNRECHYHGDMGFGKYYNKSISYVIRKDLNYIKWALKNKPDFILRGDDLEEFIEKAGYDPYASTDHTTYPSDETIVDLASILRDSGCELDSVVFKTSYLPDTKTLLSLTEKYPSLRYNITSKGNSYLITISGDFKIGTSQEEPLVILKESTEPVFSMDEDNKRLIF